MSTRVTAHAGSLVTVFVVLTGAAILPGALATADPNQDSQFLALLAKQQIPAVEGVPSLITEAHQVCRAFDVGYSADDIMRAMLDNAYSSDPKERQFDLGRLSRTEARFMTAAVGAYCPNHQNKLASVKTSSMPHWNEPTYRPAGHSPDALEAVGISLIGTIPGQINPPDPPQLPEPPPPSAQTLSPPLPIASPPPPKQAPRPPQQPQSPPQPVAPPAAGPQPTPLPPAAPPPVAPPPPADPPPPPQAPPPPAPAPPNPPAPPMPAPPKSPPGFVQLAP